MLIVCKRSYSLSFSQQNNDCTLNRGVIYDQDEYDMHTAGYAGQLYSVTQQCELLTGVGASFCGVSHFLDPISVAPILTE